MARPAAEVLPRARRRVPRGLVLLAALGAAVLGTWLALTSRAPAVPPTPAAGIPEAAAARAALEQIRQPGGRAGAWIELRLTPREVEGLAVIGGRALGLARVEAAVEEDVLLAAASLPAGGGRWLNLRAATRGSAAGVPPVRAAIGPVRLGPGATRLLADAARALARPLGLRVPPYEAMIDGLAVSPEGVVARVRLPSGTGAVGSFAAARSAPVDGAAVVALSCTLARAVEAEALADLPLLVRRAFAEPMPGLSAVEANRVAFLAVGVVAGSARLLDLAGREAADLADCMPQELPVSLAGRRDLARHWSLSAALGATLGNALSDDLGQWKELSDSTPGRSGFSFVDIAANRSGLAWAARATSPAEANAARRALAEVTREQLFPLELLAAQEGLAAADFERRYGSVESPEYRAVVARIDRALARARQG
jgi:hypothetical protein